MLAAAKARRGKSRRPDVEAWWQRRETEVLRLSAELSAGTWVPSGYRFFEIHDPKRRTIAAAPFADRVAHHALCNLMAPLLERRFIARSFSCQTGKGTTAARGCCRKLVNQHRYVLKCDIAKFFPSIAHAKLLVKLAEVVRCAGTLQLCERIIASHHTEHREPRCGLPIGNLTSQLWGNYYLDALDHELTEQPGGGAYLRYTDDFLLFADDKSTLWQARERINTHLENIHLRFALPKSRVLACNEGVPFCGFRFMPGQRPRVLGATKRRFDARRLRLTQEDAPWAQVSAAIFAWYQFSQEGNTAGLRQAYARPCHRQRNEA